MAPNKIRRSKFFGRLFRVMAATGIVCLAAAPAAHAEPQPLKSYGSFSELRGDILDFISGATSRVWLHSDYLTDGEIVTSLFVAKYRKLDVKVLLGKKKANAYMSRLNYLKNQNIAVFLKPDSFKSVAVTAILSDNELVYVDGELDFMSRYKKFNVYRASEAEMKAYEAAFAAAANLEIPAVANQIPLVGRKGGSNNAYKPVYSGGSTGNDTYTYGRGKAPRPDGVASKLPKETKWQKTAAQDSDEEQPVPDLPADN